MGMTLADGDVLVITHKIVSRAESRCIPLDGTVISPRAQALARTTGKDARVVEWILREAKSIIRVAQNHIITEHRLGHISANSGVDRSNVMGKDELCLLPEDPDGTARKIATACRAAFDAKVGVLISDSHGRPFRVGTVGTCIGACRVPPVVDLRGEPDLFGRVLEYSLEAIGDELCSAANLVMGQGAEAAPVVLISGLGLCGSGGSATDLLRPPQTDIFRGGGGMH